MGLTIWLCIDNKENDEGFKMVLSTLLFESISPILLKNSDG